MLFGSPRLQMDGLSVTKINSPGLGGNKRNLEMLVIFFRSIYSGIIRANGKRPDTKVHVFGRCHRDTCAVAVAPK